ncbi:glycosyl hydrolase [Sulfurimonas sp. RIFCSPLOWO2_12_36_12]|uniref:glycoside hydrolase family 17 protein n=1 Tax=Sulfurimonas sp. RIFCSPLOWO2_12_36_12 TaxID=1802253 RepID=UPI000A3E3A65|nr:glycosyl hydrolase [Sulfurimonas sp. RIFCSPLOWO2_12_36_12]
MTKKILAILSSIAVVTLFWYLVGEVFVLKDNGVPLGHKNSFSKLQCVSYAPFSKDQSPFDSKLAISEDLVREDLVLLAKYTDCIRTYSTVGLEMVPKIARENGLKMLMGAWVSSDKVLTQKEINALIKLANENQDIVKAVIVGNEVLLRGDVSETVLAGYIKQVKEALPNTEVTYADVWEFWVKHPKIREVTDFVTIHILPYWEDDPMNISQSIGHLADVRGEVEAILKDKNILIGETGWPSEGRMREDAVPSKINQAVFVREFVKLAEKEGWKYNIIEAFDQPWKRVSEGAVGGFWGLFDKNRVDKKVFDGDVSNFPNYKPLALGSIFLVLAFSFLLKSSTLSTKKIVIFSSINTLFAILFMLQIEQYSVTVRTSIELLWAVLVVITHLLIYYFLLYHIAYGKKPQIATLEKILNQKVLFYISFVFVLISSIALAYEGRYRNFEIYIFSISVISFLWLYRGKFEDIDFGKFGKASSLILLLTTITIFINETYLNTFSDVWILISLGFAYILYSGSKKIAYSELKNFALYIVLFFVFFTYLKSSYLANSDFAAECSVSVDSALCVIRESLAKFLHLGRLEIFAVIVAVVAFFANNRYLSVLSLFVSMGAVLLFNASLGSAAFVLSMFLVLKAFNNKSKLIKDN